MKSYNDKKDKISIQQKIYYEKNRVKLLQKQNDYRNKRSTDIKEIVKSHVELKNRLKTIEEILINVSENKIEGIFKY